MTLVHPNWSLRSQHLVNSCCFPPNAIMFKAQRTTSGEDSCDWWVASRHWHARGPSVELWSHAIRGPPRFTDGENHRKPTMKWRFPSMGVPQNGWFIDVYSGKSIYKWIWGYRHLWKPPNVHVPMGKPWAVPTGSSAQGFSEAAEGGIATSKSELWGLVCLVQHLTQYAWQKQQWQQRQRQALQIFQFHH